MICEQRIVEGVEVSARGLSGAIIATQSLHQNVGQSLRLSLSKAPNRVGAFFPHPRTETDPVSEMLCFLVFRIPEDDGQSPESQ
jgi:hypothetical protein